MDKKRNRSVNWDDEERQIFRSVLKDHIHVIQNKALDSKSVKLKNKAWEEIYKKFNKLNRRPRQLIQLQIHWRRMKLNAQKRWKEASGKNQDRESRPESPSSSDAEVDKLLYPSERLQRENYLFELNDINLNSMGYEDVEENLQANHIQIKKEVNAQEDVGKYPPSLITIDEFTKEASQPSRMKKKMDTVPAKVVQKIMSGIQEDNLSRKDHDYCIRSMVNQIKMLKEEGHKRRLQMAEEEHSIKMAIQKEKLKSATIEREILELKKQREEKNLYSLIDKIV